MNTSRFEPLCNDRVILDNDQSAAAEQRSITIKDSSSEGGDLAVTMMVVENCGFIEY